LALTVSAGVATVVSATRVCGSLFCMKVSVPPFFGACACARPPPARARAEAPTKAARRVVRNFTVMFAVLVRFGGTLVPGGR